MTPNLLNSRFQPVTLEFRVSRDHCNILRIGVEAKGQIQGPSNINGNGNPGYTRPELATLDSSRSDHHEDDRNTWKYLVPKLRCKSKRRISSHDDQVEFLPAITAVKSPVTASVIARTICGIASLRRLPKNRGPTEPEFRN